MYGQTEATARMSYLPWNKAQYHIGSIGHVIPGGEFAIEGDDGKILSGGEAGELIYTGPNVCMGYAQNIADLALGDVNNGVLRTGDIAQRSEDGFFYITGRKSRFLKLFGNRVNLDEIEKIISERFGVCACSGTDSTLLIFLENKSITDKATVLSYISERTHIHCSAFKVFILDKLPRAQNGKINYSELRFM